MRLTCVLACFVLLAILVPSCKSDREKKLIALLDNAEKIRGKPTGQIVPAKAAQECFRAYDSVMKLHGFVDSPSNTPTTIALQRTLKITRREAFRGKELMGFLKMAAYRHARENPDDGDENMTVQIAFGLYTENYLKSLPGAYDASKLNRIGVFLVTCKWDDTKKEWVPFQFNDDPSAFDFGGLEP
jgi:hypothetical protein